MKLKTSTLRRVCEALLRSGRRPSGISSSAYETLTRAGLLSPEEETALARVDALGEIMFLMMVADGNISAAERDALRGAVRGLTGDQLHTGTINVLIEMYQERFRTEGRDARLVELAESFLDQPTEAEVAFTLAAAVAFADDQVSDAENDFINQLAAQLGIREERAEELLSQLDQDGVTLYPVP